MESATQASTLVTLLRAPSALRGEDANDLRWYLGRGGIATLTTSNWGATLERLEQFRYGCVECEDCGGDRKKKRPGDGLERQKATARQSELMELIDLHVPELTGEWCKACGGKGWLEKRPKTHARGPVTARPTGSSKRGRGGVDVDHGDLARLGSVARKLSALYLRYPAAVAVLELFYGPDHDGTVLPLYEYTPAGKTLLRRNSRRLISAQFYSNDIKEARDKQDNRRLTLHEEARVQAKEYYRAACQAWNMVNRPKPVNVAIPGAEPGAEAVEDGAA